MHAIIRTTVFALAAVTSLAAQQKPQQANGAAAKPPAIPAGVATPADYVIGPDDVLAVVDE